MPGEFLPVQADATTTTTAALEAILWLLFVLLRVCSPAIVWAVWTWAL